MIAPTAPRLRIAPVDPAAPIGLRPPALPGDVGWDLVAAVSVLIGPMQSADVPVNLRLALPDGVYADVRNRSSMARRGLYVDHGLVDTGYRGPMFVFIRNMALPQMRALSAREAGAMRHGGLLVPGEPDIPDGMVAQAPPDHDPGAILIQAGERIAQLVFHRALPAMEVEAMLDFDDETDRGDRGFGSTGA